MTLTKFCWLLRSSPSSELTPCYLIDKLSGGNFLYNRQ